MSDEKLLLTVREAAAALSLSRSKLYEEIAARRLESVRIGSARRIPREAIEHYVAALRARDAPDD